ncbi:MAG TPA: PPOX class F420-dependent oxidoreductase, partial [Euzebyales bacterium]|nr:PPOX class F420-dependent oxidoreductase [Euzebyales bacterium]
MARTIATTTQVSREGMLDFARTRHHVVLSTVKRDGGPQLSPVTAGIGPDGRLLVASYPQRAKVRNIRRNPSVSACVLSDDFGGAWVQLDGVAEVVDLPGAVEVLVDYFRCISGEHPDWDEYRQAMVDQG